MDEPSHYGVTCLDPSWPQPRAKKIPLPRVVRDGRGSLEFGPRFLVSTELFSRVHGGLYHLLADHHRGEGAGENPFRVAFGRVVQAYVGELLRQALGPRAVIAELQYREGGALVVDHLGG